MSPTNDMDLGRVAPLCRSSIIPDLKRLAGGYNPMLFFRVNTLSRGRLQIQVLAKSHVEAVRFASRRVASAYLDHLCKHGVRDATMARTLVAAPGTTGESNKDQMVCWTIIIPMDKNPSFRLARGAGTPATQIYGSGLAALASLLSDTPIVELSLLEAQLIGRGLPKHEVRHVVRLAVANGLAAKINTSLDVDGGPAKTLTYVVATALRIQLPNRTHSPRVESLMADYVLLEDMLAKPSPMNKRKRGEIHTYQHLDTAARQRQ